MRFCLDTNIWSYLLRKPNDYLIRQLRKRSVKDLCFTDLVRAELLYGACRSSRAAEIKIKIQDLLRPYGAIPFDDRAAEHYAEIRTHLEREGTPISPNDLIIAAAVRAAEATLVTANTHEFRRVPGLRCEDWTVE